MNRRTLLGSAATLSAAALAGCSVSTPFGDFSVGGDGGDTEGTSPPGTPTPTTAVRTGSGGAATTPIPCVANGTCLYTPAMTPIPGLEGDLFINNTELYQPPVIYTIDPGIIDPVGGGGGTSSVGDPSTVENSGAVKVEVTPEKKGKKDEKVDSGGSNTTGDTICTTERRRVRAGGPANFLLDPQVGNIWPGSILTANSIAKGQFQPALNPQRIAGTSEDQIREPLQLSISLMNVDGKNTTTVNNPSVGNVRTARDRILGRYNNAAATPAKQKASVHQIHSEEQLDVNLGVHYSSPQVSVDNQFDFSSQSETNKLLVKFWQIYYTIDVSLGPNPVGNGIVSDAATYLKPNDVIVKNVSYGRVLMFSAESKYNRTDLKNALKVGVNTASGKIDTDLTIKQKQVLRDTKIDVTVLGGSATQGAKTISKPGEGALGNIKTWIEKGAQYDPVSSPGVPISYQTKYVGNLATANTYLTTTYTSRNCRPTTRRYRVHNMDWKVTKEDDPGNEEEIYGDIYVVAWQFWPSKNKVHRTVPKGGPSNGRVWKRSKDSHVNIAGKSKKDLGVDATIELTDAHLLDNNKTYIQVTAIPEEKDPTSNDDFGNKKAVKWFLNQPPSDPSLAGSDRGKFRETWNSHGSELQLSFDISPVPPSQ